MFFSGKNEHPVTVHFSTPKSISGPKNVFMGTTFIFRNSNFDNFKSYLKKMKTLQDGETHGVNLFLKNFHQSTRNAFEQHWARIPLVSFENRTGRHKLGQIGGPEQAEFG